MLIKKQRKESKSTSMMWNEMSQITCEHHSFRVLLQTSMPNFHGHIAKLACMKLKLGIIIGLMLIKKEKSKSLSMMWTEAS